MAFRNQDHVALALRTVRVRPIDKSDLPFHECPEVLVGFAAVRPGRDRNTPKGLERWFLPLTQAERRDFDILWTQAEQARSLFGRTPAGILASGVTQSQALNELADFVGNAPIVVQSRRYWKRVLETVPADQSERFASLRMLSLGALFKYLKLNSIDDRSDIERSRQNQDVLYRYARAISLESPHKMREKRTSLMQEAMLLDELWLAASARRLSYEVQTGSRPSEAWARAYARIKTGDLGMTQQTHVELDVPFEEKELAKQRGAHWDRERRCWFIRIWQDPVQFERWMKKGDFEDLMELTRRLRL